MLTHAEIKTSVFHKTPAYLPVITCDYGQLAPAALVTVNVPTPAELEKLIDTVPGVAGAGNGFGLRVTVTEAGMVPVVGVKLIPGEPLGVVIVPVNVPVPVRLKVPD